MARDSRTVTDPDGSFNFKIRDYSWRGKPVKSPLTGRPVRCLVATDEQGKYRAGIRIGADGKGNPIESAFTEEAYATKEKAIEESRNLVRDELTADAQVFSDKAKGAKQPGERIVKVEMDDGWKVEIIAPEHCDERTRTEALLKRATTPSLETQNPEHPRSRIRGIDR
jgi:hypothetical protein